MPGSTLVQIAAVHPCRIALAPRIRIEGLVGRMVLRARLIDPRDQTQETVAPSYRVFFWTNLADGGWVAEQWELLDADVEEVLAWVQPHHHGRRASLWAVVRPGGTDVDHVRLSGIDPLAPDATWPSWARRDWPL